MTSNLMIDDNKIVMIEKERQQSIRSVTPNHGVAYEHMDLLLLRTYLKPIMNHTMMMFSMPMMIVGVNFHAFIMVHSKC